MSEMQFKVGDYYKGICDEVRVVKKGDATAMEFGFKIEPDFHDYTSVFLGSDKVGKDGKTNDERVKADLISFGCEPAKLEDGPIMNYIRSVMVGKEIEMEAGEYKGVVQFSGCRVPGSRRGPVVLVVENPFGAKKAPSAGGGVF